MEKQLIVTDISTVAFDDHRVTLNGPDATIVLRLHDSTEFEAFKKGDNIGIYLKNFDEGDFEEQYQDLKNDIKHLLKQYNDLKGEYEALKQEDNALKGEYEALKEKQISVNATMSAASDNSTNTPTAAPITE
jgi:hypothetical protein